MLVRDNYERISADFCRIVDNMDSNNCKTYSDYYKEYCTHQLDYQIAAKPTPEIDSDVNNWL